MIAIYHFLNVDELPTNKLLIDILKEKLDISNKISRHKAQQEWAN